ncbi:SRPBCC family protein [Pseudonocardia hydrocarbonoxydans]|uniref:Polyketide cyclase n=1 Tax=Pseudonocardia hydrocarbonoxydans TaxID=76726 RepID=A0A4Y3WR50_9PSEU|nr:SRPBCC family protein [Pseudonocardia hydrocarbonoxydans]GEC21362.1 polyketide cyclase [Pseudonocardia hydrocarbonoxydans]
MTEVTRFVAAPPAAVFATLADGWNYALWVVGAAHMRTVDPDFPAVGSRLHHSVGVWPLLLEDTTEVLEVEPDRRLVLRARGWPTGEARVAIELVAVAGGTRVRLSEEATSGPGALVPGVVQSLVLAPRNREALARLDAVVTDRGA